MSTLHIIGGDMPAFGAKIYVGGPMSGMEEYNYPAFKQAKQILEEAGYSVTTPPDCLPYDPAHAYEDYFRACMEGVLACEILFLLQGWHLSHGATAEMHLAKSLRMPIFLFVPDERTAMGMESRGFYPVDYSLSEGSDSCSFSPYP